MAAITTKSAAQFVQSWAAAAQAAAGQVLDFSVGSVNRAIAEGGTTIGLWLQRLALKIAALSRFATSFGGDADSWGAQFGYDRLTAKAATGTASFTRANTGAAGSVAIGRQLQTADGTQTFTITTDAANPAYSSSLAYGPQGGYVAGIGVGTLTVPVQAQTAGRGGNILAAQLTVMLDAEPGWDSVTNAAAFTNGRDAELDSDYKARFPNWLAGLASADLAAITAAIQGVQQGLDYLIVENFDYPGTTVDNGNFFAVINDGSGNPPAGLLASITAAVDLVRGFTVRWQGAYAPTPVTVTIVMVLTTDPAYTHGVVVEQVVAALTLFVNAWPLKQKTLPLTMLAKVAYDASLGVTDVTGITINGVATDLALTTVQCLSAGTMNVS